MEHVIWSPWNVESWTLGNRILKNKVSLENKWNICVICLMQFEYKTCYSLNKTVFLEGSLFLIWDLQGTRSIKQIFIDGMEGYSYFQY